MKYSEGELFRAHEKMKEIRRREAAGERGPGERQALAKISEGLEQLRHLGYEVVDLGGLTANGDMFPRGHGDSGYFALSIRRPGSAAGLMDPDDDGYWSEVNPWQVFDEPGDKP